MNVGEMLGQGVQYMGIGVGVVFAVLAVFVGVVKLLLKIWPPKESE